MVCRNPDVMGGTPVFCGTRVPVQTLFDYLEAGNSINEFLAGFPSVSRDQVVEFSKRQKIASSKQLNEGLPRRASTGGCPATSSTTGRRPPAKWAGPRSRMVSC